LDYDNIDSQIIDIKINGAEGRAVFLQENGGFKPLETPISELRFPCNKQTQSLVVPLSEMQAENETLTGGKGSSLSSLYILSKKCNTFNVPNGIIVTTNAYQKMLQENSGIRKQVEQLQSLIR
jgi:Pyruvate phosphate dikinase, AMP/ATP-binding domain